MAPDTFTNTFFPAAIQPLVTGGNFAINNTHIHYAEKGGYELLVEAVAPNALHNSGHAFDPPRCHPGTRVAVIQAITDWIERKQEETRDKHIAWLTGAAGAGKSAIGRSVCERCVQEGTLLASFFFGSSDPTRNHSRPLVATIAYQICCMNPSMRQAVSTATENDPLIFTRSLRDQLLTLLINPLSSIFANEPGSVPRLIVIDGLDECENRNTQLDILDALVHISAVSQVPIRFLVCSRPENQIINFFTSSRAQETTFEIFLDHEYSSTEEIKLYVSDSLEAIKKGHIFKSLIPDAWPDESKIDTIAEKASGQYIYAATVVRYVESPRHRPHQRLDSVLGLRPPFKDLPFSQLDALYTHILSITEDPGPVMDILALPAIHDSIHSFMAERILELEIGDVYVLLSELGPIVRVGPNGYINLLHKSLGDYMWDRGRSNKFYINRAEAKAKHIQRIMEIFSEDRTTSCRFMGPEENPVRLLKSCNISCKDWESVTYTQALNAVIQFPMRSFCKSLFSHDIACREYVFTTHFFEMIFKFKEDPFFDKIYHAHLVSFCECAIEALHNEYFDDWVTHYEFAWQHIQEPSQVYFQQTDSSLPNALKRLHLNYDISDQIDENFQLLLTEEDNCFILSRAAALCVKLLCGPDPSNIHDATRFFDIGKVNRRVRRIYPLKWRREKRNRLYVDQRILVRDLRRGLNNLSSFRKLTNPRNRKVAQYVDPLELILHIDSLTSRQYGLFPYHYLGALEYLIEILPRVGWYPPLVHLCKTKSFSEMSMAYSHLSRRARRAIDRYLERMESEGHVAEGKTEQSDFGKTLG